jgi:hypothetical protein
VTVERSPRLRRYLRKDYSQRVEFPVEIVGRDGLVRRYAFDDSVRLYHRRIHSAPVRYDDPETIDAEVRHCRQRIDQLRRSYLEHSGPVGSLARPAQGLLASALAADVACFLRRAFAEQGEPLDTLSLSPVAAGAADAYFVRIGMTTCMLYAYRLDERGPAGAAAALKADLARLGADAGPGAERLFCRLVTPDLALVLAGTGEWNGPSGEDEVEAEEHGASDDTDAWRDGLRALHDGKLGHALSVLEAGMERDPSRRALAQASALLALLDHSPDRAEFAARLGRVEHPADPLLAYLLAVALLRQRRTEEAEAVLDASGQAAKREPWFLLLAGLLSALHGRYLAAWSLLGASLRATTEEHWFVARAAATARRSLARAFGSVVGGSLIAIAGAIGVMGGAVGAGAALILGGAALGLAGALRLRARVRLALHSSRFTEIRVVSPELLPRPPEGPGRH